MLDDGPLCAGEGLGTAVDRHDGMTTQPRPGVLRKVVGDQDVDDVVLAPETVDR